MSKKSLETSVGIFLLSVDLLGPNFGHRDLLASREAMQFRAVISVGAVGASVGAFAPTVFEKSYNNQ